MVTKSLLFVSAFLGATLSSCSKVDGPIAKVIGLLQKLKDKIVDEGSVEQKVYDKYACWCDEVMGRKKAGIDAQNKRLKELDNIIVEAGAAGASIGAQIEHIEKDITENQETQAEAQALREKEAAAFARAHAENKEAVEALKKAIEVLTDAGTGHRKQRAQLISVVEGVRRAVQLARLGSMSSADENKLAVFLSEPEGFFGKRPTFKSEYAPQSNEVFGILRTMLHEFETDGKTNEENEGSRKDAFSSLIAEKAKELELLNEKLQDKKENLAKSQETLADSKTERSDTQAQVKYDTSFLAETTQGCQDKANEWAERSRLRAEELSSLAKAEGFLADGSKAGLFGGETKATSLVQVSQKVEVRAARRHASELMRQTALVSGDERLVLIALKAKEDTFGSVVSAIDDMLKILVEEEKTDNEHKAWCDEKVAVNKKKEEDSKHKIAQLLSKMKKMKSEAAKAQTTYADSQKAYGELESAMSKAASQRSEESEAYKRSRADDVEALRLLDLASKAIADFFKKNGLALVQSSATRLVAVRPVVYSHRSLARVVAHQDIQAANRMLLKDQMARHIAAVAINNGTVAAIPDNLKADADTAPEASFTKADNVLAESQGILTSLANIRDSIIADMKLADKEEVKANSDFVALKNDAEKAKDNMLKKESNLRILMAQQDMDVSELNEDLTGERAVLKATQEYLRAVGPSCEWIGGSFDQRYARRKAEMEGLNQGKAILRGAGVDPEFTF